MQILYEDALERRVMKNDLAYLVMCEGPTTSETVKITIEDTFKLLHVTMRYRGTYPR